MHDNSVYTMLPQTNFLYTLAKILTIFNLHKNHCRLSAKTSIRTIALCYVADFSHYFFITGTHISLR